MFESPIICPPARVESEWIDYNGHLNMAFYNLIFDRAVDAVFNTLDIGAAYVKREQASCFTLEAHVCYLNEVAEGDLLSITFQLLDYDQKRMHFYQEMYHADAGYLAATSEQLSMHVSMESRRSAPYPDRVLGSLADMMNAHRNLPRPERAGRIMAIPHKV
ncbi:MAG: thioesterase family protein [Pseudomonadota bacterium]